MPELPEVETTRIGITPYILDETVKTVSIRNRKLRWPISRRIDKELPGQKIKQVSRRGKYILFHTETACLILHLGMSGSLRVLLKKGQPQKHDHVDIEFKSGVLLRFTDPRRFGSIHWTKKDPLKHKLLKNLGPEPLSDDFNADYLFEKANRKTQTVKTFIMDSKIVVGVGNIYASESLFRAGIHPKQSTGKISKARYEKLVTAIKNALKEAIKKGGTTLRDFVNGEGKPGYFGQELNVYNREGQSCTKCKTLIKQTRIGQRSTFYCPECQR